MLDLLLLWKILLGLLVALGVRMALRANKAADRLMPVIEVPSKGCDPQPLRFDGSTSAYYRIWLPSAFLTLVTLGLYGPWSTMRQNRYLYGHTALGRRRFSYVGDPGVPFVLRLIWIVGWAVLVFAPSESATVGLVAWILFQFFLVPLMLHQGLRFKARSTALGGISCTFNGSWGEACRINFTMIVGTGLTLGVATPCFLRRALSYIYHHLLWGQRRIRVGVPLGELYLALGAGLLVLASLSPMLLGLAAASSQVLALVEWAGPTEMTSPSEPSALAPALFIFLFFACFLPAYQVGRALVLRAVLTDLAIEGVGRLEYQLGAGRTAWVAWVHAWACVLSLGLLIPWARVRWLRLHADHVVLHALPPEELREAPTPPKTALPKTALPVEDRSSAPLEFVL